MAIAYRNGTGVNTGTASTTTVISVPSGVVSGDRMYALVASIAATPSVTEPAGWTKFGEYITGAVTKSAVYYRDVTGVAEPGSYTWTWSTSGINLGYIVAYSGMDLAATQIGGVVAETDWYDPVTPYAWAVSNSYSWAIFLGVGRESPGTDFPKRWYSDSPSDVTRFNVNSPNTGSGADITAGWIDTGAAIPTGLVTREISCQGFGLTQLHVWALQLSGAAPAGGLGGNPMSYLGIPIR